MDWSPQNLAILALVFLLGGIVKGVIGTGLPTVAIALLAVLYDVRTAILLLMAPAIVTNVWQAFSGGAFLRLVQRLAFFLVFLSFGVVAGYFLLADAEDRVLISVLGCILCVYAVVSLFKVKIPAPGAREPVISPLVGFVNGTLTGITGTFVVPSVIYLQVLGLDRRELIQAMGITFLLSIVVLSLTLGVEQKLTSSVGALSMFAIAPALVGQYFGQNLRDRMTETTFRKVFLCGLLGLGLYLLSRAAIGF